MIELIFQIAGLILGSLLIIFLLMMGFSACLDSINAFRDRWKWDAHSLIRRDVGQELIGVSYWFSENKEAQEAIKVVGEHYLRNGNCATSTARDTWKDRLK